MRQHLAKLAPAMFVGGCSLIYNPSNIDKPMHDARPVDMEETVIDVEMRADAMPRDLTISEAFPTTIAEGSGTGNSRPAVVVIKGHNFVKDAAANLQVTLAPATAGAALLGSFEVSGNGDFIALAVNVPIDMTCADGSSVAVGVTVMQNDLMGGTISQTKDNAFSVQCLDELDTAPTTTTGLKALYSRINITGAVDLTAPSAAAIPSAILRSASSISIGAFDASGSGRNPGPGGGVGGAASANGAGPKAGAGATGVSAGGGGGGFVVGGGNGGLGFLNVAGGVGGGTTGDTWIASYAANQSSGGGGGGPPSVSGTPGIGGGGGGTVELTAPGDITVGAITADGSPGTVGNSDTGSGGAGTGGVVVIRAGKTLTVPSVSVAKGAMVGNGGTSSDGRVRVDAAAGTYPSGATRGPMFVDLPTRTTTQNFMVNLRGTVNDNTSTMRVYDTGGLPVASMTYMPLFGTQGTAAPVVVLKAGYNKICVWVAGGLQSVEEATNCQEIAYLPL